VLDAWGQRARRARHVVGMEASILNQFVGSKDRPRQHGGCLLSVAMRPLG
jgi:hypothetical protein